MKVVKSFNVEDLKPVALADCSLEFLRGHRVILVELIEKEIQPSEKVRLRGLLTKTDEEISKRSLS